MRIQAVTGVVLLALLFMSALMETKLWDANAADFFFDHQKSGDKHHLALSD